MQWCLIIHFQRPLNEELSFTSSKQGQFNILYNIVMLNSTRVNCFKSTKKGNVKDYL